ncbi:MAG: class I SAM-dependent methyltransferase [Deltaproteobacteria bacterium]|nr:class I SAM-dependent methyltransferase [Deltaproteobacteria bacterium]
MSIDPADVKKFWDERAARHADDPGLTNLEENEELRALKIALEEARVADYLGEFDPAARVLDLGGGYGHWAFKLAPRVGSVHVVDYCEPLVDRGRTRAGELGIGTVTFSHGPAQDYASAEPFDLVFISGLLLYLNDGELQELLDRVRGYTRDGGVVVLRDGTGVPAHYEITKRWSEALQANYAAIYRTRDAYVAAFAAVGFRCVRDDDMFEAGCVLNKFPETRLRIYRFER